MSQQPSTPTAEARLLAALAHGSVVFQGLGILVGLLVYVTQREKSRYAALQALQAAVYQFVSLLAVVALWVIWSLFYGVSIVQMISQAQAMPDAAPPPLFWISLSGMALPLLIAVVIGLYGLWAAIRVWQGRDFRYILIGRWLERSGLWNAGAAS
jgi:uncharacterized Tic20 family protein